MNICIMLLPFWACTFFFRVQHVCAKYCAVCYHFQYNIFRFFFFIYTRYYTLSDYCLTSHSYFMDTVVHD